MKKALPDILAAVLGSGLFLLLFFGLGWNQVFTGVLAVGAYFGASILLRPRRKIGVLDVETVQNGEELRQLMDDAEADLNAIHSCIATIRQQPAITENTQRLYETGERILSYLRTNPQKITIARRFINYYLDTASGILRKYIAVQDTQLETEEMTRLRSKTESALVILNDAFKKQFERLMENEIMDIDSDIDLLEKTLKMEDM